MSQAIDSAAPLIVDSEWEDYFKLLKPRVMSLVVFTTLIGAYLAPGHVHPFLFWISIICIAVGAGASGAINMWYDRDIDCIMKRTQGRPLPLGRIRPGDALGFGIVLSVGSTLMLAFAANYVAAALLAFTIMFYVLFYTMFLKRRTAQNIVIGGAAGAFPPMIGWTVVTGELSVISLVLFAIIFLWTPPHFWALSLYRFDDYVKANIPMLPVVVGPDKTKTQIVIYSLILFFTSLIPYFIDLCGELYLLVAFLLGGAFVMLTIQLKFGGTHFHARRVFKFSILYLFLIFLSMFFDRWIGFS